VDNFTIELLKKVLYNNPMCKKKKNNNKEHYFDKNIMTAIIVYFVLVIIYIIFLCLFFSWQPKKTVDILLGILSFVGTLGLGVIPLYQNYIFKKYADDKDKLFREQNLIINTTPTLFFDSIYAFQPSENTTLCYLKTTDILFTSTCVNNYISKTFIVLGLRYICNNGNYLNRIHIKSCIIQDVNTLEDKLISYEFYRINDEFTGGSNINLQDVDKYGVAFYLSFNKDNDEVLPINKQYLDEFINFLSNNERKIFCFRYEVYNIFNVVYECELKFTCKYNAEKKAFEEYQDITNWIIETPYIKEKPL